MRAHVGNSQALVPLTITRPSSMYVGQRDTVQTSLASWLRRRGLGHVLVADRFVLDASAADAAYVVRPSVTGVREDSEGLFRRTSRATAWRLTQPPRVVRK